ncbi:E3 ubiquitin-protein ligase RBBP6 [Perkinsela sp. CCAP 1560/4]|nr:E3 ubiquitin-protein ligase RBBP6 [Perkinsela sp. CCAP 1560/4]|eukprot:KNH09170.1 E3 ubiquitin-protein ligase RBBP6 [Perkinsela sp. CCAP 1560/4]
MPHIFYTFQNQANKVDFDSNAITAEKAKFLIAQAIGTSDIIDLTVEADGSKVRERQLLESGTAVRVQRIANKSFRHSMKDAGGAQHRKRARGGPSGDVVIGIAPSKHSAHVGNVFYTGQHDTDTLDDDSFPYNLDGRTAGTPEEESKEERKFEILQQSVRSTTRPEFADYSTGRLPLNQRAPQSTQRKQSIQRSSDTLIVDPPSDTYVCHACGYAGHWIYDCDIVKNSGAVSSVASAETPRRSADVSSQASDPSRREKGKKESSESRKLRFAEMRSWTPEEMCTANESVLREEIWAAN